MVEKRQIYFFRETVVLQLIKNFPKTSWTSVQTKFVDGSMYNFRMLTYPKTFFALDKKNLDGTEHSSQFHGLCSMKFKKLMIHNESPFICRIRAYKPPSGKNKEEKTVKHKPRN